MKVLVCVPKTMSAVEYHRLYIPFRRIENVLFCNDIEAVSKEFLVRNDVGMVWFNRNISPKNLNPDPVFRKIIDAGAKIVCDLDDNWNVGFGHVLSKVMIQMNLKNSSISQIKASNFVSVTHEHLANLVYQELKIPKHRIIIAPNAIDPTEHQYNQDFTYNHKNLFWQGSVTHHHDLKLLSGAVNELGQKLFIAGYDPTSYYVKDGVKIYHWDETGKMFKNKQWIKHSPVDSYMNFYNNKGICLIPLEKTKFTMCKSNLKMLEAGWAKKPVIVSGIHPYTSLGKDGVNCEFAYTKDAWKDSISYMLANPNYCEDLRLKLHEDVRENYLIDKANQSRINLIEKTWH
jgi:glycosyltransferase involved in cell wall biosynthesis